MRLAALGWTPEYIQAQGWAEGLVDELVALLGMEEAWREAWHGALLAHAAGE